MGGAYLRCRFSPVRSIFLFDNSECRLTGETRRLGSPLSSHTCTHACEPASIRLLEYHATPAGDAPTSKHQRSKEVAEVPLENDPTSPSFRGMLLSLKKKGQTANLTRRNERKVPLSTANIRTQSIASRAASCQARPCRRSFIVYWGKRGIRKSPLAVGSHFRRRHPTNSRTAVLTYMQCKRKEGNTYNSTVVAAMPEN